MKVRNRPTLDWVRTQVDIQDNGCWLVRADPAQRYPRASVEGTTRKFHELVCEIVHGPKPEGCLVMHSCDVSRCCAPGHVSYGTHSDNVMDSVKKGRWGGLKPRSDKTKQRMSEARKRYLNDANA